MTLALYGKSRRRQWMLVALALFALLGALSAALAVRGSTHAAAPNPALGSAVVDGSSAEWDLSADFFANMWRAGDEFKPNPVLESKLYLRYSCQDQTLYALVIAQPGVSILADSTNDQESFVKLNNVKLVDGETGDDGVVPDFAFIGLSGGLATGWEASMSVAPGSYPAGQNLGLNVHTQVSHDGSQTSAVQDRAISLNIECGDQAPTVTVEKTHADLEEGPTEPYGPGDSFEWVITVTVSDGPTTEDVIVSDQLDSDLEFVSIDEDAVFEDCGESGGLVTCTLPEGTDDGDYEIRVEVTVSETDACEVPNTVELYLVEAEEPFDSDEDAVDLDCGEEPVTRTLEVCKVVDAGSVDGGSFTIEVAGQSDFVTGSLEPGDDECTTYEVADGAEITITETAKPAGWDDSPGYPQVEANGSSPEPDTSSITVTVGAETCEGGQQEIPLGGETFQLHSDAIADCTVVFYNSSEGQVESRGLILVEKYIEIDGDLGTTLPGEGLVAGWTVSADAVSKQTTLPDAVSFEAIVGEVVPVAEVTQAGYNVLGHSIDDGALQAGSSTNVVVTEGTTKVRFYNQPLGSLNVHKDAVTSHNGGPNVPAPNDDDGWTITVVSVACGINQSKQTDASGNASFTGLPLCTDYVVGENPVNAASPGFTPISATSVSNQTPGGPTVTFVNRKATFDPPCQDCIQIVPTATPTNTPVPPTATPVPPTATPTPEEATEGEKTPGPTPIAPSTGTGGSGGSASMNILLLVAGLAVLSGGMSLTAAGRRRRK